VIVRGEAPANGGAVIGHDEGKAVLVYYALPDELVEAVPRGRQGGLQAVRTERVLEASPDRVEARCPHFGECGGCHWQHSRYERQLALKRQVVGDVWRRAGMRLPEDTPVLGMEVPWRYRIRGEFEASYRPGQPLEFGFPLERAPGGRVDRLDALMGVARQILGARRSASEQRWAASKLLSSEISSSKMS